MFTKKRLIGAFSVVAVLAAAGAAFAYFSTSGSGNGSATVGSPTTFVVTDTSTPVTLYPGTGSFSLTGTIKNQDASNEGLASASVTITAPTVAAGAPTVAGHACGAGDFTLTAAAGSGWTASGDTATYSFPAGNEIAHNSTQAFPTGLTVSMVDQGYNQNNCQGATVNWTDGASS